jgi:hypothetical protein
MWMCWVGQPRKSGGTGNQGNVVNDFLFLLYGIIRTGIYSRREPLI